MDTSFHMANEQPTIRSMRWLTTSRPRSVVDHHPKLGKMPYPEAKTRYMMPSVPLHSQHSDERTGCEASWQDATGSGV